MVLILDTARFKYPPHWVPLEMLYKWVCHNGWHCMVLLPAAYVCSWHGMLLATCMLCCWYCQYCWCDAAAHGIACCWCCMYCCRRCWCVLLVPPVLAVAPVLMVPHAAGTACAAASAAFVPLPAAATASACDGAAAHGTASCCCCLCRCHAVVMLLLLLCRLPGAPLPC